MASVPFLVRAAREALFVKPGCLDLLQVRADHGLRCDRWTQGNSLEELRRAFSGEASHGHGGTHLATTELRAVALGSTVAFRGDA